MQKQSTKNRKGDTSRTSSQGRKQSSGGSLTKREVMQISMKKQKMK